jgi:hypothetical protein
MKKYICDECGSSDVTFDATISWDYETQSFITESTEGGCYCNDCEDIQPVKIIEEAFQWKITDKAGVSFTPDKHYGTLEDVQKDFNIKDIENFQRLDLTKKVNIIG